MNTCYYSPRCSSSFPPPFCIIQPWRNETVVNLQVVSGRGTPGSLVCVKIDGQEPGYQTRVDQNGWWTVEIDEALPPGNHTLYAAQGYGNSCEMFTLPFSIGMPMLPPPCVIRPAEGAQVSACNTLWIIGKGTPNNLMRICVDADCRLARVRPNCTFSLRFDDPAPGIGTHTLRVTEEDTCTGQVSTTLRRTFTITPCLQGQMLSAEDAEMEAYGVEPEGEWMEINPEAEWPEEGEAF